VRHNKSIKKLSRPSDHRKALMKNLAIALIERGEIKTTLPKAKVLKSYIDKMVTLAIDGSLPSRRRAIRYIPHKDTIHKLFAEIASNYGPNTKYGNKGGYTSLLKLGRRKGDGAEIALIRFKHLIPSSDKE